MFEVIPTVVINNLIEEIDKIAKEILHMFITHHTKNIHFSTKLLSTHIVTSGNRSMLVLRLQKTAMVTLPVYIRTVSGDVIPSQSLSAEVMMGSFKSAITLPSYKKKLLEKLHAIDELKNVQNITFSEIFQDIRRKKIPNKDGNEPGHVEESKNFTIVISSLSLTTLSIALCYWSKYFIRNFMLARG